MKSSLEIAQAAELAPIDEIAERAGLLPDEFEHYGRQKAKVSLSVLDRLADVPDGKLVCVSGMTPTRAGEGKTTTAVSLTQGLGALGRAPVLCLREPSLGPALGGKGGAAGGGRAQVLPMEDLNLHFTGDIHAVGAANNLLAAMLDASILHGNPHQIDALSIEWKRVLDMSDRALRQIIVGRGGRPNGYPRESGFDITAASEVMAILAVARDLRDLRRRLGAITVARSHDGRPVTAEDLGAAGAMTVLLRDAIKPNLIQTLEGQPCLMHTGPFANVAHGNSSLIADLIALKLADYVVTESGFGSDMGLEKLFNIVCRSSGLAPSCVVLVATVRALKHHAGLEDVDANGSRPCTGRGRDRYGQPAPPHRLGPDLRSGLRRRDQSPRRRHRRGDAAHPPALARCGRVQDRDQRRLRARRSPERPTLAGAVIDACEQPARAALPLRRGGPDRDEDRGGGHEGLRRRPTSTSTPRPNGSSRGSRPMGSIVCRSAWPRHTSRCPPIRSRSARRAASVFRSATSAPTPAPDGSSRSAATSARCPGLGPAPAAINVNIDPAGRTVGLF